LRIPTFRRVQTALAVAALAALCAGCGGSGGRLSNDEFVAQVNTICGDSDTAVKKIHFGKVDPTSDEATRADLEKFAAALDETLDVYRDESKSLRKLKPSITFEAQFNESMSGLSSSLTKIDRASNDARKGDKAALSDLFEDFSLYGENVCGGASGLFVLRPGGSTNVLLAGKERSVDWSPDGRWITSVAGPAVQADIVSTGGGTRHSAESWKWSSDGSRIAYSSRDKLFVGPSWSTARLVTHASGSDPVDWAADGSRFAFGSGRSSSCCWPSLRVARADGKSVRTVWTPPSDGPGGSWINDATWSPNGRQIAVEATINNGVASRKGGDFVYVVDPARRSAKKIILPAGASFEEWSPDGKRLVLAWEESVYEVSSHGGTARSVCTPSCPNAAFSADGRRFAFGTKHSLWVEDVGNGTKRRVADLPHQAWPVWSADGRSLGLVLAAADGRHSGIAVIELSTGKLRRLTDGSHFDSDLSISKDGAFAAFKREEREGDDADLWVVKTNGTGGRKVTTVGACGRFAWSPTERLLAFTNGPCLPS
jgi:Tol biopolymer transport system component